MSRRAFTSQLAMVAPAAFAGVLAEAALCSVRLWHLSPRDALLSLPWTMGLWAPFAALASLLLAWLLAGTCSDRRCFDVVRRKWAENPDVAAAEVATGAVFVATVFACARGCFRFHNVELAATLLTLSVLGAAVVRSVLAQTLARAANGANPSRWLGGLSLVLVALCVSWIVAEGWSGWLQLDAGLVMVAAVCLAALVASDRAGRGVHAARIAVALGGIAGAATFTLVGVAGTTGAASLASSGAWSPYLVAALQRATDVDGDGYSSVLGGNDCAPFDESVNPGAAEIAADGIDNNCIGGDSGNASTPPRPSWGAQAHGSVTNQNVVIVTIETFRRDHASFIGSANDTTPELRKLAGEALVFERMYSAAPLTRLSIASLFSSYAPSEIDWQPQAPEKRMRRIGPATPWLPELLRARGYDTAAILTDFAAFTEQENAGFDRGFDRYDVSTKLNYRGGTMWGFPAAEQVDKALAYVQAARRPFLLWVHFFEPHYRYEQPPGAPRFGTDERAIYDAEIWHVDRQVGRLIDGLKRHGDWDKTVLLVTGDHGEAFGEHDDRWHGSNLHDPQLRPAALLRVPGVPGKRVHESVTFTDLAPTITRLLGDRQSFDRLRGRSLTPLLHRARLPDAGGGFIVESFSVDDGRAYQAALIAFPLKLIYVEQGRRFSLFDLSRDPGERRALDPRRDPRGAAPLQSLVGYLERARPSGLVPTTRAEAPR